MTQRSRRAIAALVLTGLAALPPAKAAFAWGATGHEYVSGVAAELLPDEIPAFVRAPSAVAEIAVLGRELDRSKGAGNPHDAERNPGHWINLDDDGRVAGVLALEDLPTTREAYDTKLRTRNITQYTRGYLPYAIADGWQQLAKDFAYWRADVVGARTAADPADRAWFETDRLRRERLVIRDLGVWSHYVGDASQPLHVSVHYDGWGAFANPRGYATTRVHDYFEGEFVRANVDRNAVKQATAPYRSCLCSIRDRARAIILESHAMVVPLYELQLQGAFAGRTEAGIAFATARLAAGAAATRDMIVDAWRTSADMAVGYPEIKVREIESGRHILTRDDFGRD
ncbi:MAG: S1/P1 Nuclease [Reyranellales bacterium]